MKKFSQLLFAAAMLLSPVAANAVNYVVWSGDALTVDEQQIPVNWEGWWGMGFAQAEDADSPEDGKVMKFTANETPTCSMGVYQQSNDFNNALLRDMDLVFMAKSSAAATWSIRLTATNAAGDKLQPEQDSDFEVPADGQFHEVRINVAKAYPAIAELWVENPKGYVFSMLTAEGKHSVGDNLSVYNVHYEASIENATITASVDNITETSADITYEVAFPEGAENAAVTINGDPAVAAGTLNLTGLTENTAYTYTIEATFTTANGVEMSANKVVNFKTLRPAGADPVWHGSISGDAIAAGQKVGYITVDYSITYNADKTLTIDATILGLDGIPDAANRQISFVRGLVEEWAFMKGSGDNWTYTTTKTVDEGVEVEFFFWFPYANGVFGGDYHQIYKAGSENEPPTTSPRLTAEVQNITSTGAEIAFTVTNAESLADYDIHVYYETEAQEPVEALQSPIVLTNLEANTEYTFNIWAVAQNDTETLVGKKIEVTFKTAREGATDLVFSDILDAEFKNAYLIGEAGSDARSIFASLPFTVTLQADGNAVYSIDLQAIENIVGLVPQIYWNGHKPLTKNADTGKYEYNFGPQTEGANVAISHYLAYAGGVVDVNFAAKYGQWGIEQTVEPIGEAASIALNASASYAKVGEAITLSVVTKDANNHYLAADGVTLTTTGGTISGNKITFAEKGQYTITASAGTLVAGTVINVVASETATNLLSGKVGVTAAHREGFGPEKATDGIKDNRDNELRWDCSETEAHYLIFDLVEAKNIEHINLYFEGAYATDFTVTLTNDRPSELGAEATPTAQEDAQDVVFTPAANNREHNFTNDNGSPYRYIALRTTKALNAGWGINVQNISALGTAPSASAINDADADNVAPVEYYNLQGVRVVNPANGIYVRVQGNTAKKVFVK